MAEATDIIKRPLITEKSTDEMTGLIEEGQREGQALNRYTFEVANGARKPEIKKAIESLYGVRVKKVRTQTRAGGYKRTRFGLARSAPWKRAIVELHQEDRIELF